MSPRQRIRDGLAQVLFSAGLTAPVRRGRGRLSIVTFHRVLAPAERDAYPYPGLVVTPQELDAHLRYLAQHFDCGPVARQHERYLRAEPVSRPLLALTFDDAQHDNFLNARAVLARHGLKASFFVPVEAVEHGELLWHDRLGFAALALMRLPEGSGRFRSLLASAGIERIRPGRLLEDAVEGSKGLPLEARLRLIDAIDEASGRGSGAPAFARMMTFGELAALAAEGHEIGSHSMTHRLMPECDEPALRYELEESRLRLQARLSCDIDTFCYPNGDADARCAAAVAAAGYRRAVTTAWGHNGRDADPFLLRRCDMDARRVRDARGNWMPALLAFRMSGFYPGLA